MPTKVTDPAILAQLNGSSAPQGTLVTDPNILSILNGAAPASYKEGLAMPGTTIPPGQGYMNGAVPQNQEFSSDNLNPLPAMSAFGNSMADSIPVAGPWIRKAGENVDAFIDNNVYRPLTGQKGTTTPQDVAATNAQQEAQNPGAVTAGRVGGAALPWMVASEVPVLNAALGLTGAPLSRLAWGSLSNYALQAGDNLSKGQNPVEAATNAAKATVAEAPFTLMGKAGRIEGEQGAAVKLLQNEGIPLTAGQIRGSKGMMTAESQLGGHATSAFQDRQLSSLTSAALSRAGVKASAATPDVLRQAYATAGDKFDSLASMTNIRTGPVVSQLQNDFLKSATDYQQSVGAAAPIVEGFVNRLGNLLQQNGGTLPGKNYKILMTDLRVAAKNSSSIEIKTALGNMQNALNDAVENSVGGKTREDWQKLRQQYKNLITITDAVGSPGVASEKGYITPNTLRTAIASGDKRNYAKGYGDLTPLSHASNRIMVRIPDSGTAGRLAAISAAPAVYAGAMHSGLTGGLMAAGGIATPYMLGRAMLSAPGRQLLSQGTAIPSAIARGVTPTYLPPFLQYLGLN